MSSSHLSVAAKLYCLMAVVAVTFMGNGWWSHNTLQLAKVHGPFYQQIVQGKDLLADIRPPSESIIESYLCAIQMHDLCESKAGRSEMEPVIARLAKLKSEYETRHNFRVKELPDSAMKRTLLVDAHEPLAAFYKQLDAEFIPACLAGRSEATHELISGSLRNKYEAHRAAIDEVVKLSTEQNTELETTIAGKIDSRGTWTIGLVAFALSAVFAFGCYLSHAIQAAHLKTLDFTDQLMAIVGSNAVIGISRPTEPSAGKYRLSQPKDQFTESV